MVGVAVGGFQRVVEAVFVDRIRRDVSGLLRRVVIGDGKPQAQRTAARFADFRPLEDAHGEIFEVALVGIRDRVCGRIEIPVR